MNTKLVYVLTCDPEKSYIEQALMSIFSARYWNPDANIVLITDNLTNALLTGKRGEILDYISEKIVKQFPDTDNMVYRSRWLKTSVRSIIEGDFLFIDCDTICCRPLDYVDNLNCEVGAVLESHLPISELNLQMQKEIEYKARLIGWSINSEKYYFSSGVIYAKDNDTVNKFYHCWHNTWVSGVENGVNLDQPSFAKANIESDHIIQIIPDSYNCILFTQPQKTRDAHILHISSFRNPSFLFECGMLGYVKEHGLSNDWIRDMILHPYKSYRPFDYDILHSSFIQRCRWVFDIAKEERNYNMLIGCECHGKSLPSVIIASVWMLRKRLIVIKHHNQIKDNTCRI